MIKRSSARDCQSNLPSATATSITSPEEPRYSSIFCAKNSSPIEIINAPEKNARKNRPAPSSRSAITPTASNDSALIIACCTEKCSKCPVQSRQSCPDIIFWRSKSSKLIICTGAMLSIRQTNTTSDVTTGKSGSFGTPCKHQHDEQRHPSACTASAITGFILNLDIRAGLDALLKILQFLL